MIVHGLKKKNTFGRFNRRYRISLHYFQDDWPESLQGFVRSALELSLPRGIPASHSGHNIPPAMTRGMNPKKIHEVSTIAAAVDQLCQENRCQNVIDIGSGLVGYMYGSVLTCYH